MEQSEGQFEVEKICGKRQRNGRVEYLVKWADYPPQESTWEPLCNLQDVMSMVEEYRSSLPKKKSKKANAPSKKVASQRSVAVSLKQPRRMNSAQIIAPYQKSRSDIVFNTEESEHSEEEEEPQPNTVEPLSNAREKLEIAPQNMILRNLAHPTAAPPAGQEINPKPPKAASKTKTVPLFSCKPRIEDHIFVEGKLFLLLSLSDNSNEKAYISQAWCREHIPEELCIYYEAFIRFV